MLITAKACSALKPNSAGGHSCCHRHATTAACFGNGYPTGEVVPLCVQEDRLFDEKTQTVHLKRWNGA